MPPGPAAYLVMRYVALGEAGYPVAPRVEMDAEVKQKSAIGLRIQWSEVRILSGSALIFVPAFPKDLS